MKQAYVHLVSDDSIFVMNTENGNSAKIFNDDSRYAEALEFVRAGMFEEVLDMEVKNVMEKFFMVDDESKVSIFIEDGVGRVTLHEFDGLTVDLERSISDRIIRMHTEGFDCGPMVNFISNLYSNPSNTAIDELYQFIEKSELPITEDGHFIAYKVVKDDYTDVYTGTMDNHVGMRPSMPRAMVDTDRHNTCSKGLHFCSKSYLNQYGSTNRGDDRCMLVKINPANVVSIPSDYENAKGRTWTYEVVGEVKGEWREWLHKDDYTSAPVVSPDGSYTISGDCEYSVEFKRGYFFGFKDGKNKLPVAPYLNIDYTDGYNIGYKDGRQHKAKLIKETF